MNTLSYIIGVIVLIALGYFIYTRMKKPTGTTGPRGPYSGGGGRDGRDNTRNL